MISLTSPHEQVKLEDRELIGLSQSENLEAQILLSNIFAISFLICLILAVSIRRFYPTKDYFVDRALNFLIFSLVIRLGMMAYDFQQCGWVD